jgi:hypothetical protein
MTEMCASIGWRAIVEKAMQLVRGGMALPEPWKSRLQKYQGTEFNPAVALSVATGMLLGVEHQTEETERLREELFMRGVESGYERQRPMPWTQEKTLELYASMLDADEEARP